MHMHTLTFCDILDLPEDKTLSIKELFETNEFKTLDNPISNEKVNEYMFIGGRHLIINEKLNNPKLIINGYVDALTNMKKSMYYDLRINQQTLRQILFSLAWRTLLKLRKQELLMILIID